MAQPAKRSEPTRRELVNLRMAPEDRNIIDRAAKAAGKTRTEFMLDAARRAAQETLLDTSLIIVDGKTFDQFRKLFDAPAKEHQKLRALMNLKAPWDEA